MMNVLRLRLARIRRDQAFTITEVIVVTAIFGILSALVVSTGMASLQRSRIDAIAMDLAGWLNSIHANTTAASSNVGVTCRVTYEGAATYPNASQFKANSIVFKVSNGSAGTDQFDARDCSPVDLTFKVPANAQGIFLIASPSPIRYNLRGNTLVGSATDSSQNNMSGTATNQDIKIFQPSTGSLRCIRINFLLGITTIGGNKNATSVGDSCDSSSFGSFASEKF